jgi:hypothetical protein
MKISRTIPILALSLILALLTGLFPIPVHADEHVSVYPFQGEIGTQINIDGSGFLPNSVVYVYLSSQEAEVGADIGGEVTAYEQVLRAVTDNYGKFDPTQDYYFFLPDALTYGTDTEDVHDGTYYLYSTYGGSSYIMSVSEFFVTDGSISLDITEGIISTEVEITGRDMRQNQAIIVKYDEDVIDITSGDSQTDIGGDFSCTIIIPPSPTGEHVITVIDESGNTPEATFTVQSQIILDPSAQLTGGLVKVTGISFSQRQVVTFNLDGEALETIPATLTTDHYGNFEGSFIVPSYGGYGVRELEVIDGGCASVIIPLTILGGLDLSPATSPTEPGHVGMEVTVSGSGFIVGGTVTVSYSNNGEPILLDTLTAFDGAFNLEFIIPPGPPGSHEITASDGTNTASAVFILESQAPSTPLPLTPPVAGTSQATAYFDWSDVSDESGVSYDLQVALDSDFNSLMVYKIGLEASEYTLTEAEKLVALEGEGYYWRVKAVDNTASESQWSHPRLFYVEFSPAETPYQLWFILGGIGIVVLGVLAFWLRKKAK